MSKIKVYVAGWYERREELLQLSRQLEARGFEVTSSWLTRRQNDPDADTRVEDFATYAQEDIDDIDHSDVIVIVSNEEGQLGGGGRHWEMGYAYCREYELGTPRMYTVGRMEHVFYALLPDRNFPTWDAFLDQLSLDYE